MKRKDRHEKIAEIVENDDTNEFDQTTSDQNQFRVLAELGVKDLTDHETIIYDEEYYSNLLNSLKLNEDKEEHVLLQTKTARIRSEVENTRSPFVYLKGGFHAMRLVKTLMSKAQTSSDLNPKKKEEMDREMKRISFLCERDAQERIQARHVNLGQGLLNQAEGRFRLSLRERLIEKELLAPFRHNEDLTERILQRFDDVNQKRFDKPKATIEKRPKTGKPPTTLAERATAAKERREVLIAQQMFERETLSKEKEERSHRVLEAIQHKNQDIRTKQWFTIVTAYYKFSMMYKIVTHSREIKKQDIVSWKASKTIQKAWRRYSQPVVAVSLYEKMKNSAGNKDSQHLYHNRIEAVDLIHKFLRLNYIAGKVHSYLRNVRRAQRFMKNHRVINEGRVLLLETYFQECLYLLTMQIHLVVANKGLDLKNSMTSFEINNQRNMINTMINTIYNHRGRSVSSFSASSSLIGNLYKQFFTAEFHGLIRSKMKQLLQFSKEFLQDINLPVTQYHYIPFHAIQEQYERLWSKYPRLKRKLLLAFLIQKRRLFLIDLHYHEPVQIVAPCVSTKEAVDFIKGGKDPLFEHLESINQQIEQWQEKRSKPVYPFRKHRDIVLRVEARSNEEDVTGVEWVCPILLLLRSVTAADVLTFFLELGELILSYVAQEKEKKFKSEQFGLQNVHRRLSVAMDIAEHENFDIRNEQRRNSNSKTQLSNGNLQNSIGKDFPRFFSEVSNSVPVPPQSKQTRSFISKRKTVHRLSKH